MRPGVPDIGSNSAQLQIVDVRPCGPPLPAHALNEPTSLGEEILLDASISDDGVERVVGTVADAMTAAARHDVDQLYPFATSRGGWPRCPRPSGRACAASRNQERDGSSLGPSSHTP